MKGQYNTVLFSPYNKLAFPSSERHSGACRPAHGLHFEVRCYNAQDHHPSEAVVLNISRSSSEVWHKRLSSFFLLRCTEINSLCLYPKEMKQFSLTSCLIKKTQPNQTGKQTLTVIIHCYMGKEQVPASLASEAFFGLFFNKRLLLQWMIRNTWSLVHWDSQLPHWGSFSCMGYKTIIFILTFLFPWLWFFCWRLETPLEERQHNAMHPDSALDSAGVEIEN